MKRNIIPNPGILAAACFVFVAAAGCKKSSPAPHIEVVHVDSALKADFGFKPGSYWIYRDSISGETDSAFVDNYTISNVPIGCVGPGTRMNEHMAIGITMISHSASAPEILYSYEQWHLTAEVNALQMRLFSTTDTLEGQQWMTLAHYPFITGQFTANVGCVYPLLTDSTEVTNIFPSFTIGNMQFPNTALSMHSPKWVEAAPVHYYYTDRYYLSAGVGIVKAVFDHPVQDVHRVLELQRYHIVR